MVGPGYFVGRGEELRQLERSARTLAKGKGTAVLLRGPSGIGKSALAQQFLGRLAERDDVVVWTTRCYERDAVPHNAARELIGQLAAHLREIPGERLAAVAPDDAGALARVFPALARVPGLEGDADEPPGSDLQTRGFAALRQLLRRLGRGERLAVFVDDIQWVDADTATLLSDVLRPPDAPPVLLVLGARETDTPGGRLDGLITAFGERGRVIELGPLSRLDAQDLARRLLGGAAGDVPEKIAREAAGHPFFVSELAAYVRNADPGVSLEIALDDVLRLRVEPLSPQRRELLELVCLGGEPVEVDVLQGATMRPDLVDDLNVLSDANLVRFAGGGDVTRIEPFHHRVREWVDNALSLELRKKRHRQLARAIERSGSPKPARLARHYFAAGVHDRAAHFAHRAAERAYQTLAFDQAAELYRMALRIGSFSDEREREIVIELARALSAAGRPADAADAYVSVADDAQPGERLELKRLAAEELLQGGYIGEGRDAIESVLAEVGMRLPRSTNGALASLLARRAWLRLRGVGWTPREEKDLPADELMRADACWSVATGFGVVDTIYAADFTTRNLLRSLRLGEPRRVARALAYDAAYYAAHGDAPRARARTAAAEQAAQHAGDPYTGAACVWVSAAIDFYVDNAWRRALDKLADAIELFAQQPGTRWEVDSARLYECLNLLYMGELGDLDRKARRYISDCERRSDRYGSVSLRARTAVLWLMRDDARAARHEVEGALAQWPTQTYQVQHWFGLLGLCEVALYTGNAVAARSRVANELARLERSHLLRVPMVRMELLFLRGRIALALRDVRGARAMARKLARRGPPLAAAYADMLRGGAALCGGDDGAARAALERALERLDATETGLYAAAVRTRVGELVGGDEGAAMVAEAKRAMRRLKDVSRMCAMMLPVGDE